MGAAAVAAIASFDCRRCGDPVSTRAKPGNTIRCPSCGYPQRVRATAQVLPFHGAEAATWDPPSEPRTASQTTEPCPDCSTPLLASPRGTIRVCPECRSRVTPPGVLAPYRRGQDTARTVTSQRERDLEALDLAGNKGLMLGQLRDLTDSGQLDPASILKVEWLADEVRAAKNQGRLDDLAELFKQAGIRRRRWWQGRPAAIEAAAYDDEDYDDEDQDYEDDDGDELEAAPAALATPASIAAQQHRAQTGPMTWAGALAACGWRISRTIGGCQIIEHHELCGAGTAHHIATTTGASGWVCTPHHAALCEVLTEHNRRAGL